MISHEELEKIHRLVKRTIPTRELIAELKTRGLGVYNLDMPFQYRPVMDQEISMQRTKGVCHNKTCKKHGKQKAKD